MKKFTIQWVAEQHHHILSYLHQEIFNNGEEIPDFNEGWWWIVYDAELIPVGFCGMTQSTRWSDAGYMIRVGVLPTATGCGLQKRLIKIRERKARELNYSYLISDCTMDNYPSCNSLIGCGFKMFGPTNPWSQNDQIYWRKKLR